MANNDPLRAQEIEESLSEEWSHRWIENQRAKAKALEAKRG